MKILSLREHLKCCRARVRVTLLGLGSIVIVQRVLLIGEQPLAGSDAILSVGSLLRANKNGGTIARAVLGLILLSHPGSLFFGDIRNDSFDRFNRRVTESVSAILVQRDLLSYGLGSSLNGLLRFSFACFVSVATSGQEECDSDARNNTHLNTL